MEEKVAAAERLGSASGIQLEGFLTAIQSRTRCLLNSESPGWLVSPVKSRWSYVRNLSRLKLRHLFRDNAAMETFENSYEKVSDNYLTDSDQSVIIDKTEAEEDIAQSKVMLKTGTAPHITLHLPETTVESDPVHHRKSPLTVQEWIDHLPQKPKIEEKEPEENYPRCLAAARLSREASVQSSSSLDSLLDARKPDPVEILLNLGFGGLPGVDLNHCRIPKRFLVPSKCKGGNWDEFLQRELLMVQNFECSSLGFRGLSGPSHQRPSAIVANIMEKLREREHLGTEGVAMGRNVTPGPTPECHTTPSHEYRNRFTAVAKKIACETAVLNKMASSGSNQHQPNAASISVLTPDNRKFLESQGKISPEVPRRRIIFGQKSFAINNEGECVELDDSASLTIAQSSHPPTLFHKDSNQSLCSSTTTDSEQLNEPRISSADLLKLRRSSLQRQRKIEDNDEKNDNDSNADSNNNSNGEHIQIPQRFLSNNSLKLVPEVEPEITIREQLMAEIQSLSEKIQFASNSDLTAILKQMKELRTKLEGQ